MRGFHFFSEIGHTSAMRKCPHCDTEMEEYQAQEGLCSNCGEAFEAPQTEGEDSLEETDLYDADE